MILHKFLHLIASFFLFASFILELFVILGQLSNKPFLNILNFVQVNNPQYNLSYDFGLWSYCQGEYNAPVQQCSKPVGAYDWAKTPGFDQMLPNYASSKNIERIFLAFFILFFIGMIFSFLLWVVTLPFALFCCCSRKVKHTGRLFDLLMAVFTSINFFIMLVALIIALIVVIGTVKAVSSGSVYWNGHAGISLWFTIASVVCLFMAALCYFLKACCYSSGDSNYGRRVDPITTENNKHVYKNGVFDLTPHQPNTYNTPMIAKRQVPIQLQQQQHYTTAQHRHYLPDNNNAQQQPYSVSSLSQQYSPALQPQYLSSIYTDHNQNQATFNNNSTIRP